MKTKKSNDSTKKLVAVVSTLLLVTFITVSCGSGQKDKAALTGKYVMAFYERADGSVISAEQINSNAGLDGDYSIEFINQNKCVFVFDDGPVKGTYRLDGNQITVSYGDDYELVFRLEDDKIVLADESYDEDSGKELVSKMYYIKAVGGSDKTLTGTYVFSYTVRYDGKVITAAQLKEAGKDMEWSFEFPGQHKFAMLFDGEITEGTYTFDGKFITLTEEDNSQSLLLFEDNKLTFVRKYVEKSINKEVVEKQYFEKK